MPEEKANIQIAYTNGRHSIQDVQDTLSAVAGVSHVKIGRDHHAVIRYNSACTSYDQIENYLNKLGYQIVADHSRILTR